METLLPLKKETWAKLDEVMALLNQKKTSFDVMLEYEGVAEALQKKYDEAVTAWLAVPTCEERIADINKKIEEGLKNADTVHEASNAKLDIAILGLEG